jgi:hypothetical protein
VSAGMGCAGVAAWGQCRGPRGGAAVARCLVGVWDLPRERPTPWPVGVRRAPAGPGWVGGGGQLAAGWDGRWGRGRGLWGALAGTAGLHHLHRGARALSGGIR